LGDSITTAVLLSWAKEVGDSVKEDDVIAVVETDKVDNFVLFLFRASMKKHSGYNGNPCKEEWCICRWSSRSWSRGLIYLILQQQLLF